MGNYGIKVSQDGFDVGTAADKNLAFSSKFNSPKIFATSLGGAAGTFSVGTNAGSTVTVSHNLGYQPSFLVWIKNELGEWKFSTSMGFELSQADIVPFYNYSDTSVLGIRVLNNSTTTVRTVSYHYVIFYDSV